MKFPLEDLNTALYPHIPHFTNTYTCEVTIALRVCGDYYYYYYYFGSIIKVTL